MQLLQLHNSSAEIKQLCNLLECILEAALSILESSAVAIFISVMAQLEKKQNSLIST